MRVLAMEEGTDEAGRLPPSRSTQVSEAYLSPVYMLSIVKMSRGLWVHTVGTTIPV